MKPASRSRGNFVEAVEAEAADSTGIGIDLAGAAGREAAAEIVLRAITISRRDLWFRSGNGFVGLDGVIALFCLN
jgi:hypothetical protein